MSRKLKHIPTAKDTDNGWAIVLPREHEAAVAALRDLFLHLGIDLTPEGIAEMLEGYASYKYLLVQGWRVVEGESQGVAIECLVPHLSMEDCFILKNITTPGYYHYQDLMDNVLGYNDC